ncbi:MAG TPA: hypothetical protein VLG91_22955 [Streptomyces sp.]|nr:hypothetical protein [Streptomyces sp.]
MTAQAAAMWDHDLDNLFTDFGQHFGRVEPRRLMRNHVRGPLAPVGRRNSRQPAEHAGHSTPDGLRHLLSRPRRDPDDTTSRAPRRTGHDPGRTGHHGPSADASAPLRCTRTRSRPGRLREPRSAHDHRPTTAVGEALIAR